MRLVFAALALVLAGAPASATPDARLCAIRKLKAASRKSAAELVCFEQAIASGAPLDPSCLAKADARFTAAFARAEARGGCVITGDAGSVETTVDACVENLVSVVPASTTTTVTTTSSSSTLATTTTFPQCGALGNSCDGACPDGSSPGICGAHAGGGVVCVGRLACVPSSCTSDADCGGGKRCVVPGGPFGLTSCCGSC